MLSFVDDKTLEKVAEAFGSEEAVMIIEALKGVRETTDDNRDTTQLCSQDSL